MNRCCSNRLLCLGLPLLLLLPLLCAGGEDPTIFSFVQMTDMHLHDDAWIQRQRDQGAKEGGYRNLLVTPGRFRTAIEWVNTQTNLTFAVFTGDIIEEATPVRYAAFTQRIRDLRIPWIVVPGNHDYKLEALLPADKSHGGVDFTFSCAGIHFVGFQTFNPPGYMSQLIGRETMERVAWFLDRNRDTPVIFLEHAPLRSHKGETDSWEVPRNAVQMYDIIRKCGNVVAVLCGHDHPGFSRVDEGLLHACAPGFCEQPPGGHLYSFLVWAVHPSRLEGTIHHVSDSGHVVRADAPAVDFPLPATFRLTAAAPGFQAPRPLEAPGHSLLEAWFGKDWIYAPGYALPPSWRDDVVLLAGKTNKPCLCLECPPAHFPPKDRNGRVWFEPEYVAEAWRAGTIPTAFSDGGHPQAGASNLFFRLRFDCVGTDPAACKRGVVKRKSYALANLFLNGRAMHGGAENTRDYWGGFDLFSPELLKPQGNVIAAQITTSGWGGYDLDLEVAAERRGP